MGWLSLIILMCYAALTLPPTVDGWGLFDISMCYPGLYHKGNFIGRCIWIYLHYTIWLADGSVAAWKVEHFSTFWRRQRSRQNGRTHNAFRECPMQSQWDPSTDGGSVNAALLYGFSHRCSTLGGPAEENCFLCLCLVSKHWWLNRIYSHRQ